MVKIPTIFERDWANGGVILPNLIVDLSNSIPTEKVDGTNVRVTIRSGTCVRLEKRRNPTKIEKARGVIDPWYVDGDPNDPNDIYLYESVKNFDFSNIPDGEHSAEALGPKIQSNPLNLKNHTLFIFSVENDRNNLVIFGDVPTTFADLKLWIGTCDSVFSPGNKIEGIVFWKDGIPIGKIKRKDFGKT